MSGGSKVVHQDYIVRQRYHNTLPPPPGAPKLLHIPFNPMAAYLSPFYTERIRRAEPINIEADAFLGMPIDLVGVPGVFDGDEKAIQAPLNLPPIHPRDKMLLRPLKALGKGGADPSDISFLRRTQYVANDDRSGRGSTNTGFNPAPVKRRRIDSSKEDATSILRSAMKGFDIANPESAPSIENGIRAVQPTKEELDAWNKPKHPSKPHLRVLDTYPLLPDLDAITNAPDGGYSLIKIMGQPTHIKDRHDERFDTAYLRTLLDALVYQDYQTRLKAHSTNPTVNPKPPAPTLNFELFLPDETETLRALKRKRDIHDEERDSSDLNTHRGQGIAEGEPSNVIKLKHLRNYESGLQTDHEDKYQEVALALYEADSVDVGAAGQHEKAAYFYPISSKMQIKQRRKLGPENDDEEQVNEMDLKFKDVDIDELERREGLKSQLEGKVVKTPTNGEDYHGHNDDADGDDE